MQYILFTSLVNPTNHRGWLELVFHCRDESGECIAVPQNDCLDKIYSNTENIRADAIFCFRHGWFPLSFDPDSEIILGRFLLAGHEIFTSDQMNNTSSITHFYTNAVPMLCLPLGLLSQQDMKWNASNNMHCWHMSYITYNAVWGQMGWIFF